MYKSTSLALRLRRRCGCYSKISRTAGISASWLSMFARGKRGKRPSYDLIQRLIAALDALDAADAKLAHPRTLAKPRKRAVACRARTQGKP